ncbi:hypothetical protein DFQ30_010098 [Apophysomyces sp. BC1015]|nr:hypothetical protein DFQ30_010098 [Apophysomyces sp. BC1015]
MSSSPKVNDTHTMLPPPSALFGSSYFYPSNKEKGVRPVYILPPPTSMPGYHFPPISQPLTPPSSSPYFYPSDTYYYPPQEINKKRKRTTTKKSSPVIEKKQKTDAVEAAAATLASFANASCDVCTCDQCQPQQIQVLEAAQILMNIARCGMRVSVVN